MSAFTPEQLQEVLAKHRLWLLGQAGGERADLRGAYLRDAQLQGAYLRDADLQGAYLRDADLRGAYLRGAYLRDADLQGAYLRDADLRGAYLRDADLRGAYLRGADLRGAYLRGAYLRDADLQGADLQGAQLLGAQLQGAKFYEGWEIEDYRDLLWVGPLGSRNDFLLINLRQGYVQTGCFGVDTARTLDDFAAQVKQERGGTVYEREYLATVDYVRALIEARKQPEATVAS